MRIMRLNRLRWRWLIWRNRAWLRIVAALDPARRSRGQRARRIHRELWGAHGYQYRQAINPKERDS